jgi:hypothetical protein
MCLHYLLRWVFDSETWLAAPEELDALAPSKERRQSRKKIASTGTARHHCTPRTPLAFTKPGTSDYCSFMDNLLKYLYLPVCDTAHKIVIS